MAFLTKITQHEGIKAVKWAVGQGYLVRPKTCSRCGQDQGRIQFHHKFGYRAILCLSGEWLCRSCHTREHKSNGWEETEKSINEGWRFLKSQPNLLQATCEALMTFTWDR